MRDDNVFDIDPAVVAEAVRPFVQQALMAVTGRLDNGARPRRPQPRPSPVVLELAEETPGEHQRRRYREAGQAFRGINNARDATLAGR